MAPILSRVGYNRGFGGRRPIPSAPSTGNASIATASVVGFWPFNSSINATIGSHTTTDYGSVTTIQSSVKKWSTYSNSLLVSGSNSSGIGLRLSAATNWTWASGKTLEAWVYPISPPSAGTELGRLFGWGDRQDNVCFQVDRIVADGTSRLRTNSGYVTVNGNISANTWNWIVISRSGTEMKVFINGGLQYTGANGDGTGYTSDGQYFHLSSDYDTGYSSNPSFPNNAYWQDVIVYNATPFHTMSSIDLPNISATSRII